MSNSEALSAMFTTASLIMVLFGDLYGLYLAATHGGPGWLTVFLLLPPAHALLAAIGTWSLLFGTPPWFLQLLA